MVSVYNLVNIGEIDNYLTVLKSSEGLNLQIISILINRAFSQINLLINRQTILYSIENIHLFLDMILFCHFILN